MENDHKNEDLTIIKKIFVTYTPHHFDNSKLNNICSMLSTELKTIGMAFVGNVSGTLSVICMPFTMALANIHDRERFVAHLLPYIEQRTVLPKPEVMERGEKQSKNKAYGERIRKQLALLLYQMRDKPTMGIASAELLRQGTVLIWGALEALVRDLLETIANKRTLLAEKLINSSVGKKLFHIKIFDIDTLARYNFDISNKMGSIITQNLDMSNLTTIKSIYKVIFSANDHLIRSWSLTPDRRKLLIYKESISATT